LTTLGRPASEPTQSAAAAPAPSSAAPWPPVTAIVPTRDRPPMLARAVRSVVGQSYPGELECVIVFDQSSPAPVDVELPAGRRVRLLTNTRTPGAAGARNTGIAACDGSVVAFCDDDDTWHPDKLRLQVERLSQAPAGFVACGMRVRSRQLRRGL
jgi:glycosyltransferase involved in cell wall biosynthesis